MEKFFVHHDIPTSEYPILLRGLTPVVIAYDAQLESYEADEHLAHCSLWLRK